MKQTVFIVDDDAEIAEMLRWLLESVSLESKIFSSAEDFLAEYDKKPGCLILDIRMRGMGGLKLQEVLREKGDRIPIIFLTGHGDILMAVRAMKFGAVDFFTKPFNNQLLLDAVQYALAQNVIQINEKSQSEKLKTNISCLTSREYEVMLKMVEGKMSKTIAQELIISLSTVEAHRSKVMKKMGVNTLAALVKLILKNNLVEV